MKMTLKYYIKNVFWGAICSVLVLYSTRKAINNPYYIVGFLLTITNGVLFPFSKALIEKLLTIAPLVEVRKSKAIYYGGTIGGGYILYFTFIFLTAIPMSLIYFISSLRNPTT